MVREGARRRGLDQPPAHAPLEADVLASDLRPRIPQDLEDFRVTPEVHADFLQDRIGVVLDNREPFLAQDLVSADPALDIRGLLAAGRSRATKPGVTASRPATPAYKTL